MAPSATDYVQGLRRMWWILVVTMLMGVGLGAAMLVVTHPTDLTTVNALFTFRIDDAGQESGGSARDAEATVAQSRLSAYVQIARSSPAVKDVLERGGVDQSSTRISTAGSPDSSPGIMEVRIPNGELGQAEAADLVQALTAAMIAEVTALDTQQEVPSLRPDVLVTEPQPDSMAGPPITQAFLPVLILLLLGLGVVYLLVWRQDRIHGRHDIETRLGARVLGDLDGGPADAPAITLALRKGRVGAMTALLVPAGGVGSPATSHVGMDVAAAGRELGLDTHWSAVRPAGSDGAVVGTVAPADSTDPGGPQSPSLTLIDAGAVGLNAESLQAAATVDIVALIVEYGVTSYSALSAAGRTMAELTEAEIAVIGVPRGGADRQRGA